MSPIPIALSFITTLSSLRVSIHTTRWGGITGNAWTANLADDVSHTLFTFNEAQGEYGTRVINEKVLKIIHEYML